MILALFGLALIALTFWNISKEEASPFFIHEFLWFLDFKRKNFPLIFWAIIIFQFTLGLSMVVAGVFDFDISWLI